MGMEQTNIKIQTMYAIISCNLSHLDCIEWCLIMAINQYWFLQYIFKFQENGKCYQGLKIVLLKINFLLTHVTL